MIADGRDFYGVETSGRLKVLTQQGGRAAHLHTNHCFDPVLRRHERVARTSTTFRRMELASTLYVQQRPRDAEGLWSLLSSHEGYPRSICSHVDDAQGDPSASRTCGRMVMDLSGPARREAARDRRRRRRALLHPRIWLAVGPREPGLQRQLGHGHPHVQGG
jgi:hypothetical protein